MNQKLENILNECLEQMLNGESIEGCLKAYPEQASELEPLLKTSLVFIQKSSAIQPAPEFKARVHSRLQAMFYAQQEKAEKRARIPIWYRRWTLAMTAILGFLLIGVGTVAASAYALPDEPLYPVKLAGEQVRLTLASSDMDKAKLHIQFAERRAMEIAGMACQGKGDRISVLTEQFANHLNQIYKAEKKEEITERGPKAPAAASALPEEAEAFDEGEGTEELKIMLSNSREKSLYILENALGKTPQATKPGLQQAIEDIREDYDETLSKVEIGSSQ